MPSPTLRTPVDMHPTVYVHTAYTGVPGEAAPRVQAMSQLARSVVKTMLDRMPPTGNDWKLDTWYSGVANNYEFNGPDDTLYFPCVQLSLPTAPPNGSSADITHRRYSSNCFELQSRWQDSASLANPVVADIDNYRTTVDSAPGLYPVTPLACRIIDLRRGSSASPQTLCRVAAATVRYILDSEAQAAGLPDESIPKVISGGLLVSRAFDGALVAEPCEGYI